MQIIYPMLHDPTGVFNILARFASEKHLHGFSDMLPAHWAAPMPPGDGLAAAITKTQVTAG